MTNEDELKNKIELLEFSLRKQEEENGILREAHTKEKSRADKAEAELDEALRHARCLEEDAEGEADWRLQSEVEKLKCAASAHEVVVGKLKADVDYFRAECYAARAIVACFEKKAEFWIDTKAGPFFSPDVALTYQHIGEHINAIILKHREAAMAEKSNTEKKVTDAERQKCPCCGLDDRTDKLNCGHPWHTALAEKGGNK